MMFLVQKWLTKVVILRCRQWRLDINNFYWHFLFWLGNGDYHTWVFSKFFAAQRSSVLTEKYILKPGIAHNFWGWILSLQIRDCIRLHFCIMFLKFFSHHEWFYLFFHPSSSYHSITLYLELLYLCLDITLWEMLNVGQLQVHFC